MSASHVLASSWGEGMQEDKVPWFKYFSMKKTVISSSYNLDLFD